MSRIQSPRLGATRALLAIVLAAVVSLLAAPPALAQFQGQTADDVGVSPPRPGKADDTGPVIMTYLAAILLFAAAVGVNLMPAKRGHQD